QRDGLADGALGPPAGHRPPLRLPPAAQQAGGPRHHDPRTGPGQERTERGRPPVGGVGSGTALHPSRQQADRLRGGGRPPPPAAGEQRPHAQVRRDAELGHAGGARRGAGPAGVAGRAVQRVRGADRGAGGRMGGPPRRPLSPGRPPTGGRRAPPLTLRCPTPAPTLPAPCFRRPTPSSRPPFLPTSDFRLPPDSRLPTPDSRLSTFDGVLVNVSCGLVPSNGT